MASVSKRCDCPRSKWSKCPHSWTVRWWGTDGKQHEKSFKRNYKLAADHAKAAEAAKLSVHRGDPAPPSTITLAEYADTWLPTLERENTRRAYTSALRKHVLPQHGRRQLADIAADREGIQALLRGASPGMQQTVYFALRALLAEAKEAGRITDSQDRLRRLRYATAKPAEFRFPSYQQLAAIAARLGETGAAVWIMRGCGLRPSEVMAVRGEPGRPGGPGFSRGRLRVSEQQTRTGLGRAPLKARKPGDYRDVPVPGYVTAAIGGLGPGYLFSVTTDTFRRRFNTAATEVGLAGMRMHDLRHVFASVSLAAGVPITDVSRWLGHTSIEITYRTYSHFIPDSWDQARAALDAEYAKWSAS